MKTFCAVP